MKVQCFAGLKMFFPSEMELEVEIKTVSELRNFLSSQNPDAEKLLNVSRFASGTEILQDTAVLDHNVTIVVLPPSSGG